MPRLSPGRYPAYKDLIEDFADRVADWTARLPGLLDAQRQLAAECNEAEYPIETPIVFNQDLLKIQPGSSPRWLVIADNPGKKEQLAVHRRYLVGSSGKTAENFFNTQLDIDFRQEVLIINKTPIHTPKTMQLRRLRTIYPALHSVLDESQAYMAGLAWHLHGILGVPIWLMGLSELKPRGLFATWHSVFSRSMPEKPVVYAFNHFSMGSFATDFKRRRLPSETAQEAVLRIGEENRRKFFPDAG